MTVPADDWEEWVLWTHKCNRFMTKEEWQQTTHESSHFFAHPPHPPVEDDKPANKSTKPATSEQPQAQPTAQEAPSADKAADEEEFRCDLSHLPLPSRNFFLKGQHCKAPLQHVEYSVFKKGVFPKWEDENCEGEWFIKHYFPPNVLDEYWVALVRGVMAGKIDSRYVAGIRVVDKSHSKHPLYRIELWLNTSVQKIRDQVRDQAMKCITMDPHYAFKFHWRKFELDQKSSSDEASAASQEVYNKQMQMQLQQQQEAAQAGMLFIPPPQMANYVLGQTTAQ